MANDVDRIREELVLKEEKLLENGFRRDADNVAGLVDEGCVEITEFGIRHEYRPGQGFEKVDGELYIQSDTLKLIDLSEACKLLLYTAAKVRANTRSKSSCSSVWKKTGGTWRLVFHQRTSLQE